MSQGDKIAHSAAASSGRRRREASRVETREETEAAEVLDRAQDKLRRLSTVVVAVQEEERRRIARELHDDLSQRLAAFGMRLASLRRLPIDPVRTQGGLLALEQEVETLLATVRRVSHELHPFIVEDLGLTVALRRLMEQFRANWPGTATFELRGEPRPVADVAAAFYRIAQEALRNISKHGVVGPVTVTLSGGSQDLRLTIRDSGPGFDVDAVRKQHLGLGLLSMQERAHLVGGTFLLSSCPGDGTTIEVHVSSDGPKAQT